MNTPLPFKVSDIEANYFNALWEVADTQEKGNIAGNVAVQFFMNSGLQGPVLREIWNIADAKKQNYLGRDEFIVALRCIAMVQQGLPVSMNDLAKHGQTVLPLPKFAGLMQPKAQGWTMTLEDRTKYEGLFPRFDEDGDGFIQGKEAVELLSKSGLDRLVLKKIWELADTDADSKLNLAVGCRIPPLNASSGGTSAKDTAFGDLASMMPKITPKPKPKPAPTPAASALTPPAPTPAVVSVPPAPSPAPAPAPAPVVSSSPPPPANKGFDNFDNVPPAPAPVAAKAEEPKDSFGDMGGMGSLKDMSTMEEIQKPQLSNMSLTPPRDMPKPSNSGHGVVLDPQVASTAKEVKVLAQDTASNARDLVSARSSSSSMNNGSNNQSSVDSGVALKALQEAMNELKGTKTALENEVKAAREEISANEQKQALLNQTASTPSPQVQEAAKQLEELKAEVSKLWQDLSSTRQEVSQSRIALQTTEVKANVSSAVDEAQIVQFANEMASLRQTRTSLLNEIQVAREEIDKLKLSAQQNSASSSDLNSQRTEAEATSKVMSLLVETHRSEIEAAKTEIVTLQNMKQQIEKDKNDAMKLNNEIQTSLTQTQTLLQSALTNLNEKRNELNAIKNTRQTVFQTRDELSQQTTTTSSSSTATSSAALQSSVGEISNLANQVSTQVSRIPVVAPAGNTSTTQVPPSQPPAQTPSVVTATPPPVDAPPATADAFSAEPFPSSTSSSPFPSSSEGFVEAGEVEFPETTTSSGFDDVSTNGGSSGWAMVDEGGDNAFPASDDFPSADTNSAFPDSAFPATDGAGDSFGNFDSFGPSGDAFQSSGSDPFGPPASGGDAFGFS